MYVRIRLCKYAVLAYKFYHLFFFFFLYSTFRVSFFMLEVNLSKINKQQKWHLLPDLKPQGTDWLTFLICELKIY